MKAKAITRHLLICFIFISSMTYTGRIWASDFCILKGVVIDAATRQPLSGVTITTDTGNSTISDIRGEFRLALSNPDPVTLFFSLERYTDIRKKFILDRQKTTRVVIEMNEMAIYTEKVVVSTARFPEVEQVEFITPDYVIQAPGAFEDTLQSLQALPGVINGDDYSARLFIRGGRPDQNGIYLDGVPVYDPYRLFGLTSLFNPETIDDVRLIAGGFDARYGDRLSAVIDVSNRYGDISKTLTGSANISLTNANLVAEGRLLKSMPSSWLFSARRTYYDLILKQTDTHNSSYPSFTDLQGIFYLQPNARNQWVLTLLSSFEGTDLYAEEESVEGAGPDQVDVLDDQKNQIGGLNGSHMLKDNIRLSYNVSYTQNKQVSEIDFLEAETSYRSLLDQNLTNANSMIQAQVEWYLENHAIETGFMLSQSHNTVTFNIDTEDPRWDIPDSLNHFGTTQDFYKFGAYLQNTWDADSGIEIKTGVRWDESALSGMSRWSPRISLRWQRDKSWAYRAAWGHYYQFPSYETLQGDGYFMDLRGIRDLRLKPEFATHYILSTEYQDKRGWEIQADIYYKDLSDLYVSGREDESVLILNENDQEEYYTRESMTYIPENARHGYSAGIELTFKMHDKYTRPYYGLITYALSTSRSKRDGKSYHYDAWDKRHSLTWIAGWIVNDRWELGWKWNLGSGFPYTPLTRVIRVVDDINSNGEFEPELGETFSYQRDDPDNALRSKTLTFYHRLDFRVQYSHQYRKFHAMYYLDIINLYGQENVTGYSYNADYTQRETDTGMPFLPSFGIKIKF